MFVQCPLDGYWRTLHTRVCDQGWNDRPAPDTEDEVLGYFDDELPRFIGFRARIG